MLSELEKLEDTLKLEAVMTYPNGWEGSPSSLALLGISLPEENHLALGYSSYPMTNPYGGIKVFGF